MATNPSKKIRQITNRGVHDNLAIGALMFNKASGGQKNLPVGPHLKPLFIAPSTYTTNATSPRTVKMGTQLAIYNSTGSVNTITLAAPGVTPVALGIGITDANGNVGIPCAGNSWSYISVYDKPNFIANSASLHVFVVEDDTYIADESISK
jgi:hypothetical protein